MTITKEVLDALSMQAKSSPRLRMNKDMRTSADDGSQRMLNALEPGTVVPVHRHRYSTETVAVLRGAVRVSFFDEMGKRVKTVDVYAGGECPFYDVPKAVWHGVECLKEGTIIFESKDGAFVPTSNEDILTNHE